MRERALAEVEERQGGRPYAIPAGASVHKYGGLGYVGFAEEVCAQEAELGVRFDYVVVCTVTGSTQAGMMVGSSKDGRQRRVIGIDACGDAGANAGPGIRNRASTRAALVKLGSADHRGRGRAFIEDYATRCDGIPSRETREAIRL